MRRRLNCDPVSVYVWLAYSVRGLVNVYVCNDSRQEGVFASFKEKWKQCLQPHASAAAGREIQSRVQHWLMSLDRKKDISISSTRYRDGKTLPLFAPATALSRIICWWRAIYMRNLNYSYNILSSVICRRDLDNFSVDNMIGPWCEWVL